MRDNKWLEQRLDQIWILLFPEVERLNQVNVQFKGRWRNKFGHIKKLKDGNTEIVINAVFKDLRVPDYIIEITLAHELVHFMHGFNSPHLKRYKHPHKGRIVEKEMIRKGFGHLIAKEKEFLKNDWPKIVSNYKKPRIRRISLLDLFRIGRARV